MTYFFTLGTNQSLSVAEICAVFPNAKIIHLEKDILILDTAKFDAVTMIKRLGGTIKIGEIVSTGTFSDILDKAICLLPAKHEGKFHFGISSYLKKINTRTLGMELKKELRERGISCRWVISREKTLSSVVVEQNKLTRGGMELNLIGHDKEIFIGITLAVQDFKGLSARDYGRPARDDHSGMIPPKLAQIMINLSGARETDTILDPFCGSGTVLQELALMNFQDIIGSDISPKAVEDSKKNLTWLNNSPLERGAQPRGVGCVTAGAEIKVFQSDATQLSKYLKSKSVNTIITEPYLGPQRGALKLNKIIPELENLYSKAIAEFHKILKPGGRIVMVWPTFRGTHNVERITSNTNSYNKFPSLLTPPPYQGGGWFTPCLPVFDSAFTGEGGSRGGSETKLITPNYVGFEIINPAPNELKKQIKLSNRNTIIYGRDNQRVHREIVILEKIKEK